MKERIRIRDGKQDNGVSPASILHKSIAGRYRSVRVAIDLCRMLTRRVIEVLLYIDI